MSRGQPIRYTLYRYSADHFAVDCEPHNAKVANLQPDTDPRRLLAQLAAHDELHEQGDEPAPTWPQVVAEWNGAVADLAGQGEVEP